MREFRVFELSHLAKLTNVEASTAKNWTNGRIMNIQPSIRKADIRGARNLFNEKDVLKVYLASQMSQLGFTPKRAIEAVLDRFDILYEREGFEEIARNPWILIKSTRGDWEVSLREARSHKLTFSYEGGLLVLCLSLSEITTNIKEGLSKRKGGQNAKNSE